MTDRPLVPVVAGALMRADGGFMLGSRPEGKPYAGYWEFPGGKVEAGESHLDALAREFHEEMGITVREATPWQRRVHHYEHASVELLFFRIWAWDGEPQPHEGQRFAWQEPGRHSVSPMLPANASILKALCLPDVLDVSCAHESGRERLLDTLTARQEPGWVLLREPGLDRDALAALVGEVSAIVHPRGGKLIVNADPAWLAGWPVDGVHLSGERLAACEQKPRGFAWVGASCHDRDGLERAAGLELDYALLGHVQDTPSHPGQAPLGWDGLAACLAGGAPLPVFAIGGLDGKDLNSARHSGAHGIARMRRAWQ